MSLMDEIRKAAIEVAVKIDLDHTTVPGDVVQKILKLNLARKYEAANHLLINSIHDAYSAADERDTMRGWAWESSVVHGKKSGENRSKDAKDIQNEWQEFAELKWKIRPWLFKTDIARLIVENMIKHNERDAKDEIVKVYSVGYVSRKITKNT